MNSRRLLLLGVAAVVAIALGLWLGGRRTSSDDDATQALYPELKQQLDQVTSVRIVKAGDQPGVDLARRDSGWVVVDRADYPADTTKLRKLLGAIADAKVFEEKTSKPDQYPSLGVEDVSAKSAGGVRIEVHGPKTPVNLIVGKPGIGSQSTYVRRAGEQPSWLVATSIDTSSSPDAWLQKEILDVRADRIQSVTTQIDKSAAYAASKSGRADANFAVSPLPRSKELSSPAAANQLATALTGLTLADVQPASAFEAVPRHAHATFRTFDGLIVEVDGWKREDKHYIALRTAYDAAQAEQFKVPVEEPAAEGTPTAKSADDKPGTTANVEEEAKSSASRLSGWAYEIPEYKYEAIFKPLDSLLKS